MFNIIRGLDESKEIKNNVVQPAVKSLSDETTARSIAKDHQANKFIKCRPRTNNFLWTDDEKARFTKAIQIFGRNPTKVTEYVGTRTKK